MEQFRDREISKTGINESQREKTDALLRNLGADTIVIETISSRIDDDDVQNIVTKLRTFAEENPGVVLGALSALIAGGAVAAGRAVVKRKSAARKKKAAAKASKASSKGASTKRASSKRTSSKT